MNQKQLREAIKYLESLLFALKKLVTTDTQELIDFISDTGISGFHFYEKIQEADIPLNAMETKQFLEQAVVLQLLRKTWNEIDGSIYYKI